MNANIGLMPKRIWIEMQDKLDADACDVTVEMEDGTYYTALFVTLPYLRRQLEISYEVCQQLAYTPAVRYVAMETPHIFVERLDRDTIEDTIDNLLALDTFETVFSRAINLDDDDDERTAEVTAVVLTEALKAEETTVA